MAKPTQVEIRRGAFEAHVRECGFCETATAESGERALPCAAGHIMLIHYMRALHGAAILSHACAKCGAPAVNPAIRCTQCGHDIMVKS